MCKIWTTYIQTCRDISQQASHAISFTLYSQCVKYEQPSSKHVEIFHNKPAMQSASPYTASVLNMNHLHPNMLRYFAASQPCNQLNLKQQLCKIWTTYIQTYRDSSPQAIHAISFTLYSQWVKYEPPTSKHVEIFHYKPAIQSALPYKSVCKIWTTYIQTCRDISLQASHTISFTLYSQSAKYEPPTSKHVEIFHYKPVIQSASPYTASVQNEPPSSKHVEIFHNKPAIQ